MNRARRLDAIEFVCNTVLLYFSNKSSSCPSVSPTLRAMLIELLLERLDDGVVGAQRVDVARNANLNSRLYSFQNNVIIVFTLQELAFFHFPCYRNPHLLRHLLELLGVRHNESDRHVLIIRHLAMKLSNDRHDILQYLHAIAVHADVVDHGAREQRSLDLESFRLYESPHPSSNPFATVISPLRVTHTRRAAA